MNKILIAEDEAPIADLVRTVLTDAGYPDASQVSGYAYDAMCWMTMHGIIGGTTQGTLDPQGPATRAQVATILQRFVETMNG